MASNTDVVKKNYTISCLYYVSISLSVCLSLCNHQNLLSNITRLNLSQPGFGKKTFCGKIASRLCSGVLLKLEVGIRKRAWQRAWRYMLIYDHWGEYTLSKNPGGWYTPYTRVYPPPNTPLRLCLVAVVKECGRRSLYVDYRGMGFFCNLCTYVVYTMLFFSAQHKLQSKQPCDWAIGLLYVF